MTCPHCERKEPRHRLGCPDGLTTNEPRLFPRCPHCSWYFGQHGPRCYITKRHLPLPGRGIAQEGDMTIDELRPLVKRYVDKGEGDYVTVPAVDVWRIYERLDTVEAAAHEVMDEWDLLGPTGTHSTLRSHQRLRAALGRPVEDDAILGR